AGKAPRSSAEHAAETVIEPRRASLHWLELGDPPAEAVLSCKTYVSLLQPIGASTPTTPTTHTLADQIHVCGVRAGSRLSRLVQLSTLPWGFKQGASRGRRSAAYSAP